MRTCFKTFLHLSDMKILKFPFAVAHLWKTGLTGHSLKQSAMIWKQIQKAKRERKELHVIWLDPVNKYESVPRQLINYAMSICPPASGIQ